MKKSVLVFTSGFPPSGGSGIHRVVKSVKYLDHFGWSCHVLSAETGDRIDTTLTRDIPPATRVYRKKSKDLKVSTGYIKRPKPSFLKRVMNKLSLWLLIPQRDIISVLLLLPLGKRIISTFNIRIIFATIPSFSIAVGAACLKRITDAKLVLDFRDPWAESHLYNWSPLKRWIQSLLEKWAIMSSDVIVTNTERLEGVFKAKYSDKNILTINNGYDPIDFSQITSNTTTNMPLTMVHAGEFYSNIRNPKSLLVAVGELNNDGKIDSSALRIHFIGGGELVEEDEFVDLVKRYKLSKIVNVHKFMPHKEVIRVMMRTDVLLLMQNSQKASLQIPAKAFEYLYLRKPILSLSPDGATSSLIRETESGFVVHPENIELMKEKILELISLKRTDRLHSTFTFRDIERYDRRYLTSKLSEVFKSLD